MLNFNAFSSTDEFILKKYIPFGSSLTGMLILLIPLVSGLLPEL